MYLVKKSFRVFSYVKWILHLLIYLPPHYYFFKFLRSNKGLGGFHSIFRVLYLDVALPIWNLFALLIQTHIAVIPAL